MRRISKTTAVAMAVVSLTVLFGVSAAVASTPVWWGLNSGSWPANLPPGGTGKVIVTAQNRGYEVADGSPSPFVLQDTLPAGVEVRKNAKGEAEVEAVAGEAPDNGPNRGPVTCAAHSSRQVECTFGGTYERHFPNEVVPETLLPGEELEMRIAVKVSGGASSAEVNTVGIAGGNASEKTLAQPLKVGEETSFGVEDAQFVAEEENGLPATQAGIHPFQMTTVLNLNASEAAPNVEKQEPAGLPKDLTFQTPPGLIGNPTPFPRCTEAQFGNEIVKGLAEREFPHNECPPQTAIGLATITYNAIGLTTTTVPLFNLVPQGGEAARFGFVIRGLAPVILQASVRNGGDYGVTVRVPNITEQAGFLASKVTLWGVPGDPRHDSSRGWQCVEEQPSCAADSVKEGEPPPFLSLPTACTGPMRATGQADSWTDPEPVDAEAAPLLGESEMGALDGCNRLSFAPSISVAPDLLAGSTPTGLTVQVHVPQTSALNPEGLAESALKNTTVALPAGVAVNPGGADGLEACSEAQVGFTGFTEFNSAFESGVSTAVFTPTLAQPFCPDASKIGTAEVETPLLPNALKGAVYLATPAPHGEAGNNPFGSLVAMYIVAQDPVSGVLVKIPGAVSLNQQTGQLTATFANSPDVPFENLRLHFFGESRAPLGTPALCGAYTTSATFGPWSGNPASTVSSAFDITSGPNGGPCQSPLPFAPSFTAGSTNIQAGAFSAFTMTMSREDGDQNLKSIELHMPPGLSGLLSGIPLCGEAQADAGTCGAESLVGETTVGVGLGGNPYTVTGGKVYLTGPYAGAPFGLSIVNPANAGPFHLGNVVVRAKLEVNPITAAVTVTSDTSGPYAIPPMIDGIPLQIKHINVTVNRRGGFTFNPTNCAPLAITGKLGSTEGAADTLSVPFQATNCAILKFQPKFKVSTSAHTSRVDGASLSVKLSYPSAPFGSQANIKQVKVELPKALPSRLGTLQKACTAAQFHADPAGCPAASIVGHAKAITPLVPVPLEGPAYFVSNGGEAFPNLIVVLQGYGVTIDLVGDTFISKAGVTFEHVQGRPRRPSRQLRADPARGPLLGAGGEREPL